ncbi:cytochrome P450 4g15-like [Bacillus rossius redtenbacheri]|uniref:cytochrome P450 4g15-like n=1 Tax=Bacillus rossius redtenbacheri TaxID=93214 RepID=UPI002FDD0074
MVVPQSWAVWCVSAVVISLVSIAVRWCFHRSRYFQLGERVPGPAGVPLLGNTWQVVARREDILRYLKEMRERYGAVARLWFGPVLFVGFTDPKEIAVILSSSKTLNKPMFYKTLNFVFGNSLLTAESEDWKRYRKILDPAFRNHIIDSYVSTFHEKSQRLADLLEEHSAGEPINMADHIMPCALEMLSETSLGVPMDIQGKNHIHSAVENFPKLLEMASYVFITPWLWFKWTLKCYLIYYNNTALVTPIRSFVTSIVKDKMDFFLHSKNKVTLDLKDIDTPKQLGFLEQIVSTLVENPELLNEEELKDQAMFVIASGTDTTAYTVATTLMLLGLHQDVQRKVLQEQEIIFGEDMSRSVTAKDLKEMVYLEQVINETMRLYPVIPLVARRADEDVRVNSYTFPAGTIFVIPIYLVHRESDYFPNPDAFDPDRFSSENSASRPASSFIPFTYGRKTCIGKRYAYIAMKTMLSVLLRRYEVLECGSREYIECFKYNFFFKFQTGHKVKLGPRMK